MMNDREGARLSDEEEFDLDDMELAHDVGDLKSQQPEATRPLYTEEEEDDGNPMSVRLRELRMDVRT